jgi:hypothetical protein
MVPFVSEAVFKLTYDGEALRDGEMDVADLAPALLGIGELSPVLKTPSLGVFIEPEVGHGETEAYEGVQS